MIMAAAGLVGILLVIARNALRMVLTTNPSAKA